MQARRRQPETEVTGNRPAAPRAAVTGDGHNATSPWDDLSNPLAGYAQVLASRLAAGPNVRCAVVRLEPSMGGRTRTGCALGASYTGPVCGGQLEQWSRAYSGGWLGQYRSAPDAQVEIVDLSAPRGGAPGGRAVGLLKQLRARHALLSQHHVGKVALQVCLLLSPQSHAMTRQQAQSLQAAMPAITGRLSLVVSQPVIHARARKHTPLSKAERAVFPLLLQRLSERAIAERLDKSRNTIHSHVKSIYLKLDVHSRKELRARAQQLQPHAEA